ncbi:hypothetical protein ACN47E_002978 [Coniothyrium glycines]
MFPFPESNPFTSEPEIQVFSATRPPQFNGTHHGCGYRCGEGCEEPASKADNGNSSNSSDSATYFDGASNSVANQELTQPGATTYSGEVLVADESTGERASMILRIDEWDDGFAYARYRRDEEFRSEDMEVLPCSAREPSSSSSNHESNGNILVRPGIEEVTRGMPVVQLSGFYYFSQNPLRLSPQHEHCRGEVISHLVIED